MNTQLELGQTAFAKILVENGPEFYMNELEVEMGRERSMQGPKYFCIGETNTISKNHARIFWKDDCFYIANLSKNKVLPLLNETPDRYT